MKKEADADAGNEPAPKKAKAAPKKGKKAKAEEEDSDEAPPPKKSRKKAAKVKIGDESAPTIKAEGSDEEDVTPPPAKKKQAPPKAASRKIKSEDVNAEDDEPMLPAGGANADVKVEDQDFNEEAEASEEAPKVKKGRKPAVKKEPKAKATASKPKAKPKEKVILNTLCLGTTADFSNRRLPMPWLQNCEMLRPEEP